ncbi:MAG: late competence development ComFB family protein [Oscillospiraceae bacterium]
MELVNIKEIIVRERLDAILAEYDCCKCETCRGDIMALVLNSLKPAYVNTHKGELFKRCDACILQNTVDIDVSIASAVQLVSQNPRHVINENVSI